MFYRSIFCPRKIMQNGGLSLFLAYLYPEFRFEYGKCDCNTQYGKLLVSISWTAVFFIMPLCLPWRAQSGVKVKGQGYFSLTLLLQYPCKS